MRFDYDANTKLAQRADSGADVKRWADAERRDAKKRAERARDDARRAKFARRMFAPFIGA